MPTTTLDQHRAVNIGQYDIEGLSNIDVWPYIIGGQNATGPHMFPWFARLVSKGTCRKPKPGATQNSVQDVEEPKYPRGW